MKNRAKCKLCGSLLESYHKFDYVSCKCGEISITGGNVSFESFAKDYANFLRVDDNGNEIPVKVIGSEEIPPIGHSVGGERDAVSRKGKLSSIIEQLETLPQDAMNHPLTHYDLVYILRLIKENIT
jgi:hypothetical protein